MDIFTQKKLLVRIVVVLIILNLGMISIFLWKDFFHRPPQPKINESRDISRVLERELKLTPDQVAKIKTIREDFAKKEKDIERDIKAERDSMNSIMFNISTSEELVKSIARRVAENVFKMEILRFDQAAEVKSVCNPAQLEKFESMLRELRDYFQPDNNQKQPDKPKRDNRPGPDRRPERK